MVLVQEPDVVTTVLAVRTGWLKAHPQEAAAIIRAHSELTRWIQEHPQEAQRHVVDELSELTQAPMPPELVASAWARLKLTDAIDLPGLRQFVKDAQSCDLLDHVPDIEGLIYQPQEQEENHP